MMIINSSLENGAMIFLYFNIFFSIFIFILNSAIISIYERDTEEKRNISSAQDER